MGDLYRQCINEGLRIFNKITKIIIIWIEKWVYLEMSQADLADAAGLSLAGVQKIERGETAPTARTQAKLARAFEKRGVTFTGRGLEYSETPIFFIEGASHEATYLQLLDDVGEHLTGGRDRELLVMFADDRVSPPSVNAKYRDLRAAGVRMRQLVEDGNRYLMGPLDEYRYVPQRFFINRVTLVYGDRVASEAGNVCRASIKVDPVTADLHRNTFNLLWDVLAAPAESEADERF
jgi:transcriptional regulator with XRE-family HTH domain